MMFSRLCAVAASCVLALPALAALAPSISTDPVAEPAAPDPGPAAVARHCVRALARTTLATQSEVRYSARAGIALIVRLDYDGAPDAAIERAARETLEAVRQDAARGAERVNGLADRCVGALRDAGAPRELVVLVNDARRRALGQIGDSARAAGRHVLAAADYALNN